MKKCVLLICCVVIFGGAVRAGLWEPALLNPSFESVENGAGPSGNWGYVIDDWYQNVTEASVQAYWETASNIGLVGDGLLWAGTNAGSRFYQAIGNYDGDETLTINMLIGARGGSWPTAGGVVSIYAGGLESGAGDGVELSGIAGVSLLDTITVFPADGTEVSTNVYDVSVELSTGTGTTEADLLWLEFGTDGGRGYFDNITIETDVVNKAVLVSPTPSGVEFVPVDANLVWGPPPITPNYYDLWFGDPNTESWGSGLGWVKKLDKQNQTEYDAPSNLAFETKYYWRVDAYEPNTVGEILREGNLWSFTTAPNLPIILSQPQSVTVAATDTAVFTVGGVNLVTAQWYKDGGLLSGETSTTLTVNNVQLGDEGYYDCIVGTGNSADDTVTAPARLWIKRLIGHWKFEDNLTDEVGDWPGTFVDPNTASPLPPVPVAVYETNGFDGKCLDLPGTGDHVLISDSNEFFNFYPLGYTVSAWVKNPNAGWGAIAGKQNRGRSPDRGWVLNHSSDTAYSTLRQTTYHDYGANVGLMDGDWHLVTGVFDPISTNDGQVKCYVDGQVVADSGTEVISGITGSVAHMVIGAEGPDGRSPLTGLVDEVRLYSHDLTVTKILELYGKPIITEQPQNQTITAGLTATLTVSAVGKPPLTYEWFDDTGTLKPDAGKYSGTDSNTLTVTNFQADEQGAYYCQVSTTTDTVTSETANLILPQLVSHWTFDTGDNLNDTVGSNHGSAFGPSGPTYDPSGIVGDRAIVLDGTEPNDVVVVPYAYGLNSTQFTVSLWAKVAGGAGTYRAPLDSRSEDGTQTYGFNLYASNGDTWSFWSGIPDTLNWNGIGSAPVVEDEWAFLVMTYDATTQIKQLYVNGELDGEQTVPLPVNPSPNALGIGGRADGGALFNGSIDDVKVYGYVLGAYDIADEYVGIVPTASVCPDKFTDLDYDYDGDCDVDIADFAEFAAKWDNCNRVAGTGSGLFDCK